MQTAELIVRVSAAGGQLWLEDGKVRARLPESLRPMLDALRAHRSEIAELLAQRPAMPAGVRLIRWEPKAAPVRLSEWSTVTDVDLFMRSTLMQLEAALEGLTWQSGNWGLCGLLERLAAVGCIVALDDPRRMLQ
jgi:hypothetical protein